jgi:RimJ/RimL family protein N-acetyltransferase
MDTLPYEIIRGDGVLLRAPREEDADDIAAGCADPLTQRFVPVMPSPYRREDALWWITEGHRAPGRLNYVVADSGSGRVLGGSGLHHLSTLEGTGEIGYWVAPWARGRGVATTSTRLLSDWAFRHGLARIELLTRPDNWRSQRVAIAAGYRREGLRRAAGLGRDGARHDLIAWARLATDPAGPSPRRLPDLRAGPVASGAEHSGERVETGSLTDGVVRLRPLWTDDVRHSLALHALPEVIATSVPPTASTAAEVGVRCAEAAGRWLAGDRADLVIEEVASGSYAGEIGLYYAEPVTGQAMIGYSMLREWRGRGYATRAVRLLAAWAFEAGIARLIAGTAPDNTGSQRVLERAGFVREGYQRRRLPGVAGTRIDDVLYALLPEDLSPTRRPQQ